MIFRETNLKVTDNSGAKDVLCIGFSNHSRSSFAKVGDLVVVVVKTVGGESIVRSRINLEKGQIYKGVVLRSKKLAMSNYVGYLACSFSENSVSLLNNKLEPLGTRVYGPLFAFALRKKGFLKLLSLCVSSFF